MSGEGRSLTCTQQGIKSYSVTQLYLLKTIFVFNTLYFSTKGGHRQAACNNM